MIKARLDRLGGIKRRSPIKINKLFVILLALATVLILSQFYTSIFESYSDVGSKQNEFNSLEGEFGEEIENGVKSKDSRSLCEKSKLLCRVIELKNAAIKNKNFIKNSKNIPRFIHQTWKSADAVEIQDSKKSFIRLNPGYEYILWTDNDVNVFLEHYHPKIFDLDLIIILKADFFRYAILNEFGGLYSDIDTECLKPIDSWLPDTDNPTVETMFGVEADTILEPCTSGKYGKCFARPLQFTQWTLVSTSKHQLITEIVEEVSKALLVYDGHFPTVWEILDLTGPGIWSDVIIKNLISRTGKKLEDFSGIKDDITVGEDLRMLTITGFSSGRSPPLMGAHPRDHPLAYVAHKFMGSWKNEQYKCKKTSVIPPLDGRLEGAWDTAPWSTDFSDKTTHEVLKPRFKTNFKMLYDNNHLYIAAKIEDPHIWANLEVDNYERKLSQYVELYINPRRNGKNFYKFEINPVNEIKESKQGGTESPIKISGLQHKVHINGTLNSPQDIDKYWSFTIAIPWDGLSDLVDNKVTHTPPNVNELWMIDFSRFHWKYSIHWWNRNYIVKNPTSPENWIWSGLKPQHWGLVEFE